MLKFKNVEIEDIDKELLNDRNFVLSLIKLDSSSILKIKDEFIDNLYGKVPALKELIYEDSV